MCCVQRYKFPLLVHANAVMLAYGVALRAGDTRQSTESTQFPHLRQALPVPSSHSPDESRAETIRDALRFFWNGYRESAWGADQVAVMISKCTSHILQCANFTIQLTRNQSRCQSFFSTSCHRIPSHTSFLPLNKNDLYVNWPHCYCDLAIHCIRFVNSLSFSQIDWRRHRKLRDPGGQQSIERLQGQDDLDCRPAERFVVASRPLDAFVSHVLGAAIGSGEHRATTLEVCFSTSQFENLTSANGAQIVTLLCET